MPALGQVLPDVAEGAQAQLPPDVSCILLFDHQHLSQRLNLIFHLCRRKNREQLLVNLTDLLLCGQRPLPKRCLTFDSSVCRWSRSSWVRSEAEHLLSVPPVKPGALDPLQKFALLGDRSELCMKYFNAVKTYEFTVKCYS